MIPIQVQRIPEVFNLHLFRNWCSKHILTEQKPFYAGTGISKTNDFMMKISRITSFILVVCSGLFVLSCGQINTKDEGLDSKTIE